MSRLIMGPFNRVEGDLEVSLEMDARTVRSAKVVSPLYRGFEKMLQGKDPSDALVFVPRICGICSVSQSTAAASALAKLHNVETPPNGQHSTNIILATENVADHLTHFYMFFMPDFTRETYKTEDWFDNTTQRFTPMKGDAAAQVLPARAEFLHILGILAGKWPHTLSIQPGGTTKTVSPQEKFRLAGIILKFRNFLEKTVFGANLEKIGRLTTYAELENWLSDVGPNHSDFSRFMFLSKDLNLKQLGKIENRFMSYGAYETNMGAKDSGHLFAQGTFQNNLIQPLDTQAITEDVSNSWMVKDSKPRHPFDGVTIPDAEMKEGYTWCKAPRLNNQSFEVGALARQMVDGQSLIADAVSKTGSNVENRILARMLEIAKLVPAMQEWINALTPGEPFRFHGKAPIQGQAVGLVEAARGSLGHWLVVKNGKILNYQIVAPTTWNFSPRDSQGIPGPLEQALVGAQLRDGETDSVSVQHIVRSFDPCMVCTVH